MADEIAIEDDAIVESELLLFEVEELLPPVDAVLRYARSRSPPQRHAYIKAIAAVVASATVAELRSLVDLVGQLMSEEVAAGNEETIPLLMKQIPMLGAFTSRTTELLQETLQLLDLAASAMHTVYAEASDAAREAYVALLSLPSADHPGCPSLEQRHQHVEQQVELLCSTSSPSSGGTVHQQPAGRVLAVQLLAEVAQYVDATWCASYCWLRYEALAADADIAVREAAARHLPAIAARLCTQPAALQLAIRTFERQCSDSIWNVRQAAATAAPHLVALLLSHTTTLAPASSPRCVSRDRGSGGDCSSSNGGSSHTHQDITHGREASFLARTEVTPSVCEAIATVASVFLKTVAKDVSLFVRSQALVAAGALAGALSDAVAAAATSLPLLSPPLTSQLSDAWPSVPQVTSAALPAASNAVASLQSLVPALLQAYASCGSLMGPQGAKARLACADSFADVVCKVGVSRWHELQSMFLALLGDREAGVARKALLALAPVLRCLLNPPCTTLGVRCDTSDAAHSGGAAHAVRATSHIACAADGTRSAVGPDTAAAAAATTAAEPATGAAAAAAAAGCRVGAPHPNLHIQTKAAVAGGEALEAAQAAAVSAVERLLSARFDAVREALAASFVELVMVAPIQLQALLWRLLPRLLESSSRSNSHQAGEASHAAQSREGHVSWCGDWRPRLAIAESLAALATCLEQRVGTPGLVALGGGEVGAAGSGAVGEGGGGVNGGGGVVVLGGDGGGPAGSDSGGGFGGGGGTSGSYGGDDDGGCGGGGSCGGGGGDFTGRFMFWDDVLSAASTLCDDPVSSVRLAAAAQLGKLAAQAERCGRSASVLGVLAEVVSVAGRSAGHSESSLATRGPPTRSSGHAGELDNAAPGCTALGHACARQGRIAAFLRNIDPSAAMSTSSDNGGFSAPPCVSGGGDGASRDAVAYGGRRRQVVAAVLQGYQEQWRTAGLVDMGSDCCG